MLQAKKIRQECTSSLASRKLSTLRSWEGSKKLFSANLHYTNFSFNTTVVNCNTGKEIVVSILFQKRNTVRSWLCNQQIDEYRLAITTSDTHCLLLDIKPDTYSVGQVARGFWMVL